MGRKKNKQALKAEKQEVKKEVKQMVKDASKAVKSAEHTSQSQVQLQVSKALAASLKQAKLVNNKMHPAALKYLSTIINPDFTRTQHSRIPDGFPRPTALVRSRHVRAISPNYASGTAADDIGRFCAVVSTSIIGAPWLWQLTNATVIERAEPYVLKSMGIANNVTPGFHVGIVDPEVAWNPAGVFNAPPGNINIPVPFSKKSNRLSSGPQPLDPPPVPIPSNNGWLMEADPTSPVIAGAETVSQTVGSPVATYFESGMADAMRAVGMSVWFRCTRAQLNNGGDIAACLMPAGSALGNIVPYNWWQADGDSTTANPAVFAGQGPILNWENLARVPGAYSGKMGEGSYTYWVPQRVSDIDMVDPGSLALQDSPYIVVAGQVSDLNPPEAGTVAAICGELIVDTVWEYTTVSQVPEVKMSACVPNVLDQIKCSLYGQPTSMPNDAHKKWLAGVLRTAGGAAAGFLAAGPAGAIAGATKGIIDSL